MTSPRRQRGQLLILLGMWLFFGGGASGALIVYDQPVSHLKQSVERVIPKGSQRDSLESAIATWEYVQKLHAEALIDDRERLLKLLGRKDTQRDDLEPLMAKLDKRFVIMDWDFLNLRFKLKEQVSSEQWAQIVARPGG
ncbi:MAG: hypothetical protein JSR36_13110 [Proteobacteria bacterium]|nr:hypothetical protein [Pseudomonadota bacterium]